jgi:hypothetical protein
MAGQQSIAGPSASPVSRRTILVGIGTAVAVPVVQSLAGTARCAPTDWRARLAALRPAVLAEIERFAEELRPRFESGELRSFRDCDDGEDEGDDDRWETSPHWKVEALVAKRFGLEVTEEENQHGGTRYRGDDAVAGLLLSCSPRADATNTNWNHPCHHATSAVTWDVIAIARERRWYTPTPDECGDPAREAQS